MTDRGDAASGADFTQLAGVGAKTAQALRDAGIATMRDLATSSTADLARKLEAAGVPVAESKIVSQRWLFQAWEWAQEEVNEDSPGEALETSDDLQPAVRDADTDVVDNDDNPGESNGDWEEQASFIVCFDRRLGSDGEHWQTRVWDTKAMVESEIPGTNPGPWIDFILQHADLPSPR